MWPFLISNLKAAHIRVKKGCLKQLNRALWDGFAFGS